MTKTEKAIAGTWYTITCTAAVTVTQEIDGEIATLATLEKSGTASFRPSSSTITIQTEGKYHILPTKAPAATSTGGGGESGAWVSDTVQAEVVLPIGDDKFFIVGREMKIAGALVPGGKLTSLICGVDGDGLLRLRQYDPASGEYKVVGLGEMVQNNAPIPGTSTSIPLWSFEDCTLVAGRDLLLDVVNNTQCWFAYVSKFGVDGCYVDGLGSAESTEAVRYDGYLVTAAFYVEQVRQWRVCSTGEPVMPQLGDSLTVCNATWFDNTAQSSVSVQAAPWKNEVMTCYLKTAVPVSLSGVSWIYGEPFMVEGFVYVIALQQIDTATVLANLAYTLPQ